MMKFILRCPVLLLFIYCIWFSVFTTAAATTLSIGETAWQLHLRGDSAEALELAERQLATRPTDGRLTFVAASSAVALGPDRATELTLLFEGQIKGEDTAGAGYIGLGQLALEKNNYHRSDSLFNLALSASQAAGDSSGVMIAFERLGIVLQRQNNYVTSRPMFESTATYFADRHMPLALALSNRAVARSATAAGETDLAVTCLNRMLATCDSLGIPQWAGGAWIHLSVLARWRMDLDEAMICRQNALQAYLTAGDLAGEARARHYIAAIHLMRGELTRALLTLQEAVVVAERSGDVRELSGVLGDMGNVYYLQGDEERALRYYQEAIHRSEGAQSYSWIQGYQSNIGMLLTDQGRYEEALSHLEVSLAGMRKAGDTRNVIRIESNIGRCLCEMNRWTSGIEMLHQAAKAAREWEVPITEAWSFAYLGFCHLSRGDSDAAEAAFAKAASVNTAHRFFEVQEAVLLGQARLQQLQGKRAEALATLRNAMTITESIRNRCRGISPVQSRYFSQGISIYEEAIDLCWQLKQSDPTGDWTRQGFTIAQRARARSILDLLSETEVDLRPHADPRYREREQEIQSTIADLLAAPPSVTETDTTELTILRLENDLLALEEELRHADPAYTELRYPQPLALSAVQQELLEPDELILEYMLGDSLSHLWAITSQEVRWVTLPARKKIEAAVEDLLPLLTNYNLLGNDPSYYLAPAGRLADDLLRPVADLLPTRDQLIIVPSGILHYLPFEALLTGPAPTRSEMKSFADLPFLVKTATVSYIPSVSTLQRLRSSQTERDPDSEDDQTILLVGDPEHSAAEQISIFARNGAGKTPPPLPFAGREIKNIAALYPPSAVSCFTRLEASPHLFNSLEIGQFDLIHIAAHGVYNEARPQYSGLLLAANADLTGDDGFLTAEEVFGLSLPCRQLVLSACSSAMGQHYSGEGKTGLIRAFLYAGAASVVASLWEVQGETTARFMDEFYRSIASTGGASRTQALATAKRRTLSDPANSSHTAHPYFWAPFILSGNGRR
jgi:CHAT domain-containing protein